MQSIILVSSFGTYFKLIIYPVLHTEEVILWYLKIQITSHCQRGNDSFYNLTWTALPQEGI